MPKTGDGVDDAERLAAHAEREKAAWKRTLEDMQALADEREAGGWHVVSTAAGHTEPVSRAGESDRYGLVHVVPDDDAPAITEAVEAGSFPGYDVYRASTGARTFLVTELLDPETETAILVAGSFPRSGARGLVRAVRETGRTYTHLQTLDGTVLGSFEHDEPEKFFPPADRADGGD